MSKQTTTIEEKIEIEELADRLKIYLGFAGTLFEEEDVELLIKARDNLKTKISHNSAVSIVAVAFGGDMYEPDADEAKIEELDGLITLLKARFRLRDIEVEKASRIDGNLLYR